MPSDNEKFCNKAKLQRKWETVYGRETVKQHLHELKRHAKSLSYCASWRIRGLAINSLRRKCSTINIYYVLSTCPKSPWIVLYRLLSRCLHECLVHRILYTREGNFRPQTRYDAMNLTITSLGKQNLTTEFNPSNNRQKVCNNNNVSCFM